MSYIKSFVVTKNDAGQRIDKFISKVCPNMPSSLLYKNLRTKNIKLNRKRADISVRLNEGDTVDMYIPDEFFVKRAPTYDFLSSPEKNS